jgi:hypothetical protein
MTDTYIELSAGVGTKNHSYTRPISGNTVHETVNLNGEPHLATYTVVASASSATADSHLLQIMAGASNYVRIRRIRLYQGALATTAAMGRIDLFRLTTAGSSGGSVTPRSLDTADSAASATAMTLPGPKGTEGNQIYIINAMFIQTVPTGGPNGAALLWDLDFDTRRGKPLIIPPGTTNGIAIKQVTPVAGASVWMNVEFSETSFL